MCPHKFLCWHLIPYVREFRGQALERWLGHEGVTLKNGISILTKEFRSPGRTRKQAVTRQPANTLISDFPVSRTVKIHFPVYKSPSGQYPVIIAQTD